MVGGVVDEPGTDVAVEARVKLSVCLPVRLDGAEPLLSGLDADAVNELVEVHIGKRCRGLLDVALAHVCAPGEVAPELPVVHRVVGGKVARERSGKGAVVHVVRHEAGLLHEEARLGPRPGLGAARERAHLPYLVGDVASELRAAHEDGLVGVGSGAGDGASAFGPACGQDLLNERVNVRHPAPPSSWVNHTRRPGVHVERGCAVRGIVRKNGASSCNCLDSAKRFSDCRDGRSRKPQVI